MLTSIRTTFSKGFARWFLICLMALLIASFALWGIQDIFRGFRSNEAITVGNTVVSADELQRSYNLEVRQLSRQYRKPLTATEARLLGIDRQVLARATANAALDEQARNYSLGLDDAKLAATVMADPQFQVPGSGRFDRGYFGRLLQDNGMSEAGFFAEQRKSYLRLQLSEALTGDVAVPTAMQEAFARFTNETRSIAYVTLTDASLGDIGQPEPAALQKFYDERKGDFRAPEYRKITVINLTPEALAAKAEVTDDDAKADYESRKDKYTTPEKRAVQQISFPNAADAAAAASRLTSGAITFDALAAERKVQPADLDLGTVTKAQLLDPAVADAAFSLGEGKVSGVVQGRLSTVILRVTKIEPAVVTPFDQVKEQIKKDIALDRARKDMRDLEGKVEDERSGGAPLKEIGAKLGLPVIQVEAVDSQGRGKDGQPAALPTQDKLLPAVFTSDVGADTDMIDGRDAGVTWFSVDAVTPARDRTLDEARAEVVAAWASDEKARRLKARADELVKQLGPDKPIDDVAKAANLEVAQAWNMKRNADSQGLSAAAVNQVFSTPVKGAGTTLLGSGTDRIVFQVTDSLVPPFDPKATDAVAMDRQLEQSVAQDLLVEYLAKLQSDLGLGINQTNVGRAFGSGGEG